VPTTTRKAEPVADCEICGAQGVPVSLTARPDWTPVTACDDVEACWERRAAREAARKETLKPAGLAYKARVAAAEAVLAGAQDRYAEEKTAAREELRAAIAAVDEQFALPAPRKPQEAGR
jgi:hypothetical protein